MPVAPRLLHVSCSQKKFELYTRELRGSRNLPSGGNVDRHRRYLSTEGFAFAPSARNYEETCSTVFLLGGVHLGQKVTESALELTAAALTPRVICGRTPSVWTLRPTVAPTFRGQPTAARARFAGLAVCHGNRCISLLGLGNACEGYFDADFILPRLEPCPEPGRTLCAGKRW